MVNVLEKEKLSLDELRRLKRLIAAKEREATHERGDATR
jgi:hypothetical protein